MWPIRMELGHQSPSLFINAPPPVASNVALIDERDGRAVRCIANPFRIKRGFEGRVRNGRNDNTFEDLADASVLHWAGLGPAPIRFLLCTQQTRRTGQKKKNDPSPHR